MRHSVGAENLKDFSRAAGQSGTILHAWESEPPPPAPQQSQAPSEPEPELNLKQFSDQLLAANQLSPTSLTGKIDEVRVDIGLLRLDLQNLREQFKETETPISQLEDNTAPVPDRLVSLEKAASMWSKHAVDLENRLRWNNICILGLPERAEGSGGYVPLWNPG